MPTESLFSRLSAILLISLGLFYPPYCKSLCTAALAGNSSLVIVAKLHQIEDTANISFSHQPRHGLIRLAKKM